MLFDSKLERFVSNQNPDQLSIVFQLEEEKIEVVIEAEKR